MNPNIKAAKNLTEKASEFVSAHRKFLWIIAAAIAAAGITVLIVIGFTGEDGSDPRISKTAVLADGETERMSFCEAAGTKPVSVPADSKHSRSAVWYETLMLAADRDSTANMAEQVSEVEIELQSLNNSDASISDYFAAAFDPEHQNRKKVLEEQISSECFPAQQTETSVE